MICLRKRWPRISSKSEDALRHKKRIKKGIHEDRKTAVRNRLPDFRRGLVPILEPEVDIHSEDKAQSEVILREEIEKHSAKLPEGVHFMFKLSIPTEPSASIPK